MSEDDDAWKGLNKTQHHTIWDETEAKFWSQFENDQTAWRADHERHYRDVSTSLHLELRQLTGQRDALREAHARLVKDLAKVETDLRIIGDRCDTKTNDLGALEDESRQELEKKVQDWEHQSWSMTNFFRNKRGQSSLEKPAALDKPAIPERPAITNGVSHNEPEGEPMDGVEQTANGHSHTPAEDTGALVNVVDADGAIIGPVQRIDPWNQWVEAILRLPIQREVKIRRGRRFDYKHLETIYERGEAKGVKWLSCMIQAIGEVQSKRCTSCDKNQGAFEQCVIVGGDLLQKCGNCEWNRQGCHGASGEQVHIEAAEQLEKQREEEKRQEEQRIELMQQRQREYEEAQRLEKERLEQDRLDRERQERDRQYREQQYREEQARMEELRRMEAAQMAERERYQREEQERMDRERHMAYARQEEDRQQQEALARQAAERAQSEQWRAVRANTEHEHERQRQHSQPGQHEPPREDNRHVVEAMKQFHNQREVQAEAGPAHPPPQKYVLESTPQAMAPAPASAPPPSYPMSSGFKPANSGFTPMNQRVTPPAPILAPTQEIPNPTPAASVEHSPQPQSQSQEEKPEVPLVEITRENLILRHNGMVYTYPECMVGVPLVKIHPGHPYWEPEWKDVRSEIVASKERWEKKHAAAVEAEARKERSGSSKYQIGRQVNRGVKILEFLNDEEQISPYQLLAKKFMHSSKGGITSYDTLFRLCETLSELSKFNLDVTPVDWMRQRLHEIMNEQQPDEDRQPFNLPKTVHDFYHDPKLTALRHKHGFKNIGRPSGQNKTGRPSIGSNGGTPKPIKKRKSGASHVRTPRESEQYVESPLGSQMIMVDEGPFLAARSQLAKRPKSDLGEGDRGELEVEVESDFSDMDSQYEIPTTSGDFRVLQVQTRLHASSQKDTQYWSYMPEERKFEHRVLKSTNPPSWGPLEGVDFSLRLSEVTELRYDSSTLRVYIQIPPENDTTVSPTGRRGDLMVEFKRWRSMKRFLAVGWKMGVATIGLPDRMLSRWEDFKEIASRIVEREVAAAATARAAGEALPVREAAM